MKEMLTKVITTALEGRAVPGACDCEDCGKALAEAVVTALSADHKVIVSSSVIAQAIADLDAEHYDYHEWGVCAVCRRNTWPCVSRQVADDLRAALGEGAPTPKMASRWDPE